MHIRRNDRGATLLVVLVLSAVALVITAGLIYMVIESTKISGGSKRYKNALEAARAGADIMYQFINARPTVSNPYTIPLTNFTYADATGNRLFSTATPTGKLYAPTVSWPSGSVNTTINIDPANAATYDLSFDLGTAPVYRVFAKIVDTVMGDSAGSGGKQIHGGGVLDVKTPGGGITVPGYPYLYTIEILALNAANPQERAKLSALYQY